MEIYLYTELLHPWSKDRNNSRYFQVNNINFTHLSTTLTSTPFLSAMLHEGQTTSCNGTDVWELNGKHELQNSMTVLNS